MEQIDCFETSGRNYLSTLYKIPEQRKTLKMYEFYEKKKHDLNYEAGGTPHYNCLVKVYKLFRNSI